MYCPKCKGEYRDGFVKCPECGVDLVETLSEEIPSNDVDIVDEIQFVKLTSVATDIEAKMLISLLEANEIASFKKELASGGYMNIYMGYSIFGEDIFVNESDYEKAKEILSELNETETNETIDEPNEVKEVPFFRNSRVVATVILAVMCVVCIVGIVISNL